ncbi:DUF5076 domain-containing protein [Erwinia rhapontici]|uniref:hypothetical protein n=1 Tax=Erwinia rhapontici TaxID=55212 RepID=UPI003D36F999
MFESCFSVERIRVCAQSAVAFIGLVSEMETDLLTIRALERCGIADDLDEDGFPSRVLLMLYIAESLGRAVGLGLIPDRLLQRYIVDLMRIGNEVDEHTWNYGFKSGVKEAQEYLYDC